MGVLAVAFSGRAIPCPEPTGRHSCRCKSRQEWTRPERHAQTRATLDARNRSQSDSKSVPMRFRPGAPNGVPALIGCVRLGRGRGANARGRGWYTHAGTGVRTHCDPTTRPGQVYPCCRVDAGVAGPLVCVHWVTGPGVLVWRGLPGQTVHPLPPVAGPV